MTKPRSLDILFIEQNTSLLKPGIGRMAIILPYQILSGPQTRYVREWILKNLYVEAVIDLPAETFQPHTGTKTSLLLARRRKEKLKDLTDIENYPVFLASPIWIGHDRRGNPVVDQSTGEIKSDIELVGKAWDIFKDGGNPKDFYEQTTSVSVETIILDPQLRMNAAYSTKASASSNLKEDLDYAELKDLVKSIFYPGRFKRFYVEKSDNSVPFLGGSNILQHIVRTEKWISKNDKNIDQLSVKSGWILITRSGSTGLISSVPNSWDGFAISEHVIRIIPDPKKIDTGYLLAFLRSNYAQSEIAKGVFGSVIDEINPDNLGKLRVPIPKNKDVQDEIAVAVSLYEQERDKAIKSLTRAVERMNRILD